VDTASRQARFLLVYRFGADGMVSSMQMQQPHGSGLVIPNQSDVFEQRFNSPRSQHVEVERFDTPPPAPRRGKPPPLLMALQANDLVKVRSCLAADAEVATVPFWDHDVEPPLCAAVRLRCDSRIVKTLLDSDANPEAMDSIGRTPLKILATMCSSTPQPDLFTNQFPTFFPQLAAATQDQLRRTQTTAKVLVQGGARPLSNDVTPGADAANHAR